MGEKENRLSEFLNMERLQELQDNLAKALNMAFITVDYRGRPVTRASGFTAFCSCVGNRDSCRELCGRCYAHAGLHATMAGKPYICRCHAGLVEFAVPLMVDGKYMGSVMGGQCDLTGEVPDLEPVLPQRTLWEEDPELAGHRGSVYAASYEKLEATVQLVQEVLRNLLEEERNRLVLQALEQKDRELLEEKAARVNLELAGKGKDSDTFPEFLDITQLFGMLNVISRLAFLEKAEETERTACDFAAMTRYALENGEYNLVTLGEELEYIDYYLQIQRRRAEGRLHYEISVPELFYSALCPFMLLHPLVENTVKYVLDNSREGGSLTIRAREQGDWLVVAICCACVGLSSQRIGLALDLEGKRQGSPLDRLDRSLKNLFGQNCGVAPGDREDGQSGREIQIRLPLNGAAVDR